MICPRILKRPHDVCRAEAEHRHVARSLMTIRSFPPTRIYIGRAAKQLTPETQRWVYTVALGSFQFRGPEGENQKFNPRTNAAPKSNHHLTMGQECVQQSLEYKPEPASGCEHPEPSSR